MLNGRRFWLTDPYQRRGVKVGRLAGRIGAQAEGGTGTSREDAAGYDGSCQHVRSQAADELNR